MKTTQKVNQKNANGNNKSTNSAQKLPNGNSTKPAENPEETQSEKPEASPENVDQESTEASEEKLAKAENQEELSNAGSKKVTGTAIIDFNEPLPDLNSFIPKNIDLTPDYWSPEAVGETKVLIFSRVVENDLIPDINEPGEFIEKDCAYFLGMGKNGYQVIKCAATRLVNACKSLEPRGIYHITYIGTKKNKRNAYDSSVFSINPVGLPSA